MQPQNPIEPSDIDQPVQPGTDQPSFSVQPVPVPTTLTQPPKRPNWIARNKSLSIVLGILVTLFVFAIITVSILLAVNVSPSYKWDEPRTAKNPYFGLALPGDWYDGDAQQPKYLDKLMSVMSRDPVLKDKAAKQSLADWLHKRQQQGAYKFFMNQGPPVEVLLFSRPNTANQLEPIGSNLSNRPNEYMSRKVKSDLQLSGALVSTYTIEKKSTGKIMRVDYIYLSTTHSSILDIEKDVVNRLHWSD